MTRPMQSQTHSVPPEDGHSVAARLRPTWAEISRAALQHNLQRVRGIVGADVGILAMVKADGYGHGAAAIGRWLISNVSGLGVATIEEGIELREAGISGPIVVMGGLMGQGLPAARMVVQHGLTCVVHTADGLAQLAEGARGTKAPVPFHIKIDTGMTRLGARPAGLRALLDAVHTASGLQLAGVMTHLANVVDVESTDLQVETFVRAAGMIRQATAGPLIWHVGNSAAVLARLQAKRSWCTPFVLQPGDRFWVRPGIMLYGIAPFPEYESVVELAPVMAIKSRIVLTKQVPAGTKVSYSGTWVAPRASRIAVLPIGYADGYPWGLSNRGAVLIRGQRVPVVGRVTMDMVMCDVTDLPGAVVGDEAVLMGSQDGQGLRAEALAACCGTIPYEIVCRVSKRMPRVYV